jgi:hypothetical protein
MFGEESVPKIFQGDRIYVSVDNKRANINLSELKVTTFPPSLSYLFFSSLLYFPALSRHALYVFLEKMGLLFKMTTGMY